MDNEAGLEGERLLTRERSEVSLNLLQRFQNDSTEPPEWAECVAEAWYAHDLLAYMMTEYKFCR